MLLTSLLTTGVGVSWADGGPAAADLHVAQTLGERELTVVIRRAGPELGPLPVEVVTHAPGTGTLRLSASSPSATTSTGTVELGALPGVHRTVLAVDKVGAWELAITDGTTTARIPFVVPAQVVPPWQRASDYGFAAAGVLVAAALVLALRGRRSWMPWVPLMGAVVALSVGTTGAAMSTQFPPPPQAGRDVDPSIPAITDPYGQVRLNAQTAVGLTRAPLILNLSGTVVAGQPSTVRLNFHDSATGRPADDLVVHHGALVHLMIVSPVGELLHLHPVRVAPGRYEITVRSSAPGVHALAVEAGRRGGGTQQMRASITVQPGAAATRPGPVLPVATTAPGASGEVSVDGAAVGVPSTIRSRFGDDPTLQPWLGMTGHLIVVGPMPPGGDESGEAAAAAPIWSHGHAMPPVAPGAVGGQPDESVAVFGPEVDFVYTFPLPGRYQIWVQAERDFAVLTASTEVEVAAS
jgi:hypothetical protein